MWVYEFWENAHSQAASVATPCAVMHEFLEKILVNPPKKMHICGEK